MRVANMEKSKSSGKPGLLLALGGLKASKPGSSKMGESEESSDSGGDDDFESAGVAMFEALQEGDKDGFLASLRTAIKSCSDYDD